MASDPPPTAFQTSAVLNKEHEQATAPELTTDTIASSEAQAAAPTPTEKGTSEPITAAAPASTETTKDVPKGSAVVEAQPIHEGVMGYKAPGFPKSLIYSKKFFWLSDDPVDSNSLSTYVSNEKADIGHRNAAHASQTGTGLLFFAKRAEDKNHPAGILNLGEVSEVAKGDFNDFSFKLHGHKHSFQTPTKAERDGWVVAIESKSSEARAAHESLIGSAGYKSQFEKYAKPANTAEKSRLSRSRSRATKTSDKPTEKTTKATSDKPVEKVTEKASEPTVTAPADTTTSIATPATTTTESKVAEPAAPTAVAAGTSRSTGSSSDEAAPKQKSKIRSESGKRSSIFGTLLGKKDEHDSNKEAKKEGKEEKKEIKKEEKAEKKELKAEEKAINREIKQEEKAEKAAEKEAANADKSEVTPGTGLSGSEHAKEVAARVVGSPLATEKEDSVVAPVSTGTSPANPAPEVAIATPVAESKDAITPTSGTTASKPAKKGSIFVNFFNKKESQTPTTEPTSGAASKDTETTPVAAAAPQLEDPVKPVETEIAAAGEPTATSDTPAATSEPAAPAIGSAGPTTSPDTTKPSRRSSFFNNLGSRKERKSEIASESENTDGEGKKSSKLGGLFRKPSRATSGNRAGSGKTPEKAVEKPTATAEPVEETTETAAGDSAHAPASTSMSTDPALTSAVSKVDQPTVDSMPAQAVNGDTPTPVTTAA